MKAKEDTINELNAQLAAIAEERKAELLYQLRTQHYWEDVKAQTLSDEDVKQMEGWEQAQPSEEEMREQEELTKAINEQEDKEREKEAKAKEARRQLRVLGSTMEDLGLGATLTRKLITAVKKYGGVEKGLAKFRKDVAGRGWAGVEDDVCPIVLVYGTIRDQALLAVAYIDARGRASKAVTETAQRIKNSYIKNWERPQEEKKEYAYYISAFAALNELRDLFYAATARYEFFGTKTANYILGYESLQRGADMFNKVAPLIATDKANEFAALQQQYNTLLSNTRDFGKLAYKDGSFIDEQAGDVWGYADFTAKETITKLAELKAILLAFKDWAEDMGVVEFTPWYYRECLLDAQNNSYKFVGGKYYKSHLRTLEENGEPITDEDRKLAILPDFDGTEADKVTIDYTKKRIQKEYDTITRKLPF